MMKFLRKSTKNNNALKAGDCILIVLIACFCAILGVLLAQNEVFQDDWYIEASADGFFGDDNRSLLVLGPNYLITGIIYLLSLTGIRLFWLHWILIGMNFLSHILIATVLLKNKGRFCGALISLLFGLFMMPLVSFEFQFTTTAAYVVASGCVYMLDAILHKGGKRPVVFSSIWIILGAGLRFDCIYYSIAFMGLVWLFQTIQLIGQHRKRFHKKTQAIVKICIKRALPFVLTLALCFAFEVSQKILMNRVNPGFTEWNSVRTLVDDYDVPDYWEYESDYQEIGISYNDYMLMQSWNNQDPEFFTQEKYEQVLEIVEKAKVKEQAEEAASVEEQTGGESTARPSLLKKMFAGITKTNAFWIALISLFAIFLLADNVSFGYCSILFAVGLLFALYFTSIGRLIWRTEWPIWIVLLCAFISIACSIQQKSPTGTTGNWSFKEKLLTVLVCIPLVFQPFGDSQSLYNLCKNRKENPNNIGKYLYSKIVLKEDPYYVTYDFEMARIMSLDKDIYYYPLWAYSWLQQYPVYVPDTLRFLEVGAGENWGTLGQYMINLQPIQRNMEKRGIKNPFRDLINEDVRIAVRMQECVARPKEVYTYLREHYYPNVSYSIDYYHNYTVCGRFINELPKEKYTEVTGTISLEYEGSSEIDGFEELNITWVDLPKYTWDNSNALIQLTGTDGIPRVFSVTRDDAGKIITFAQTFTLGETYSVDFAYEVDGEWFIAKNCTMLQIPLE